MRCVPAAAILVSSIVVAGCVATAPRSADAIDDGELVPPVPTFTSVADCEQAFGAGACGTGAAIFAAANLASPDGALAWYGPVAYSTMTNMLVNRHYAAPAVYVAAVPYQIYVSPLVVQRYRVLDVRTVDYYRRAPEHVRTQAITSGPLKVKGGRVVAPADGVPRPTAVNGPARPGGAPPAAQPATGGAPVRPGAQPQAALPAQQTAQQPAQQPARPVAQPAMPVIGPLPVTQRTGAPAVVPPAAAQPAQPKRGMPPAAPVQTAVAAPAVEHKKDKEKDKEKEKGSKSKPCNPAQPKSDSNCAK